MKRLVFAAAMVCAAVAPVRGDVEFLGTVTIPGSNELLTPAEVDNATSIGVGVFGTDLQANGIDPRGTIVVDDGTQFVAASIEVGQGPLALGSVLVSDPGTRLTLTNQGNSNQPLPGMSVGSQGSGHLRVENGAWLEIGQLFGDGAALGIGSPRNDRTNAPGVVEVVGAGSLVTVSGGLSVSNSPGSSLLIADGAVVQVAPLGGAFMRAVSIAGATTVTGARSELQAGSLSIGTTNENEFTLPGISTLIVADGAIVRAPRFEDQFQSTVASDGVLELDGGTFDLTLNDVAGVVRGSGTLGRPLNLSSLGRLEVGPDEHLVALGGTSSAGTIEVAGGLFDVAGGLALADLGETLAPLRVTSGEIRVAGGLVNAGRIELLDSTLSMTTGLGSQLERQVGELIATRSTIEARDQLTTGYRVVLNDSVYDLGGHARCGSSRAPRSKPRWS